MPSLLEAVIAQRNPHLAGLLGMGGGMPAANPMADQGGPAGPASPEPDFQSMLGNLFSGAPQEGLSPEQEQDIRKQSMMMAGLGMLASEGSALQRAARGALMGHQAGNAARDRALAAVEAATLAERRAAIGELITKEEGVERGDVDRAIALATAQSDPEMLDRLIKYKETFPVPKEVDPTPVLRTMPDGREVIFDPVERMFFDEQLNPIDDLSEYAKTPQDRIELLANPNLVDPHTGEAYVALINKDQGTVVRIRGVGRHEPAQGVDAKMVEAAEKATIARNNHSVMSRYLERRIAENPDNPLRGMRWDRKRFETTGVLKLHGVQRHKLDKETQEFLNAQESYIIQVANRYGGVRVVANEIGLDKFFRTYGFEEGDNAQNIQNTLREVETGVHSLELQAGEALRAFQHLLRPDPDEEDLDNIMRGGSR